MLTISYFSSTQLPRLFCSSSRCSGEEERPTQKFEGFVPVYRFPYVAPAVLFTKFKIAQTAVVTLGLAPYYVYQVLNFDSDLITKASKNGRRRADCCGTVLLAPEKIAQKLP